MSYSNEAPVATPANTLVAPAPPPLPFAQRVGAAFVEHCQSANALMNRANQFSDRLSQVNAGATVQKIVRDQNSPDPVFAYQAGDPVEYWLVQGEGQMLLLPSPRSSAGFREVDDRCFVDPQKVTPAKLTSFTPAVLAPEGEWFVVQQHGSLS